MANRNLVGACMLIALRFLSKEKGIDNNIEELTNFVEEESTYKYVNEVILKEPRLSVVLERQVIWQKVRDGYLQCFVDGVFAEQRFFNILGRLLAKRNDDEEDMFVGFIINVILADNEVSGDEREVMYQLIHHLNIPEEKISRPINRTKKVHNVKKYIKAFAIGCVIIAISFIALLTFTPESEEALPPQSAVEEEYIPPKIEPVTWLVSIAQYEPTTFWTVELGGMSWKVSYIITSDLEQIQEIKDEIKDLVIDSIMEHSVPDKPDLQFKISKSQDLEIHLVEGDQSEEYLTAKKAKIEEYIRALHDGENTGLDDEFKSNIENFIEDYTL